MCTDLMEAPPGAASRLHDLVLSQHGNSNLYISLVSLLLPMGDVLTSHVDSLADTVPSGNRDQTHSFQLCSCLWTGLEGILKYTQFQSPAMGRHTFR